MTGRQAADLDWRRQNQQYDREYSRQYGQGYPDPYYTSYYGNNYPVDNRPTRNGYPYPQDPRQSPIHSSSSSDWRGGQRSDYYTAHNGTHYETSNHGSSVQSSRYYSSQETNTPAGDYERRPYRPRINYSDNGSSTRSNAGTSVGGSSRSYTSRSHGSYKKRASYMRSNVRKDYHQGTFEAPKHYPVLQTPPEPLPLLVLDLNGTLVCRDAYSSGSNSAARSKRPVARPYMKSFLQYCLGLQSPDGQAGDYQDIWDDWEADQRDSYVKNKPHGSQFWKDEQEPQIRKGATFRLLLWSSAQPHNVDSMARSILSPKQAEQLLRVYARDTLVTRRLYAQKAPSIKDLEILWTVLNSRHIGREAEARLLAESRDAEDRQNPDEDSEGEEIKGGGAAYGAASRANRRITMPREKKDGTYEKGKGYGQHNTILLDDSIEKARLQPFNHVLVGEFDREAALKVNAARKGEDEAMTTDQHSDADMDEDTKVDDVLLQMIGVLEHARYQVNISSWIRFGGLGDFAGKGKDHPYYHDEDNGDYEVDNRVVEKAVRYFSKSQSAKKGSGPRLRMPIMERSPAFWIEEGREALRRNGIPLIKF